MEERKVFLTKVETCLGPSPELLDFIEPYRLDIKRTPHQILMDIFEIKDIRFSNYLVSLSPIDRRSFFIVYKSAVTDRNKKFLVTCVANLPDHLKPTDKENILYLRDIIALWHWDVNSLLRQILIYDKLVMAYNSIEKYGYSLTECLRSMGIPTDDVTPLLSKSLRNILENVQEIKSRGEAHAFDAIGERRWYSLLSTDVRDVGVRFGHLNFSEIYSSKRAFELSVEFNNCMKGRVGYALGDERRYFVVRKKGFVIGFLELKLANVKVPGGHQIIQWEEGDYVDLRNEIIEKPTWRKNMLAFLKSLNDELHDVIDVDTTHVIFENDGIILASNQPKPSISVAGIDFTNNYVVKTHSYYLRAFHIYLTTGKIE